MSRSGPSSVARPGPYPSTRPSQNAPQSLNASLCPAHLPAIPPHLRANEPMPSPNICSTGLVQGFRRNHPLFITYDQTEVRPLITGVQAMPIPDPLLKGQTLRHESMINPWSLNLPFDRTMQQQHRLQKLSLPVLSRSGNVAEHVGDSLVKRGMAKGLRSKSEKGCNTLRAVLYCVALDFLRGNDLFATISVEQGLPLQVVALAKVIMGLRANIKFKGDAFETNIGGTFLSHDIPTLGYMEVDAFCERLVDLLWPFIHRHLCLKAPGTACQGDLTVISNHTTIDTLAADPTIVALASDLCSDALDAYLIDWEFLVTQKRCFEVTMWYAYLRVGIDCETIGEGFGSSRKYAMGMACL